MSRIEFARHCALMAKMCASRANVTLYDEERTPNSAEWDRVKARKFIKELRLELEVLEKFL